MQAIAGVMSRVPKGFATHKGLCCKNMNIEAFSQEVPHWGCRIRVLEHQGIVVRGMPEATQSPICRTLNNPWAS